MIEIDDTPAPITAVVVDDEAHVRTRVIDLLREFNSVELVGESGDGINAVEMISRLRPDLVLLDIQMPVLDGFDVLHALDPKDVPVVVFVTAFDRHAIKAFDVNAVDYVLKPIDEVRFTLAINRAVKRIAEQRANESTSPVSQSLRPCRRLLVKKQDRQVIVKTADILWIEAADKYVKLHTAAETLTCRSSMRELETKLDDDEFVRIHRSAIVNIGAVVEVQPYFHGEYKVIIKDGSALPLGRTYKQSFQAKFQFRT